MGAERRSHLQTHIYIDYKMARHYVKVICCTWEVTIPTWTINTFWNDSVTTLNQQREVWGRSITSRSIPGRSITSRTSYTVGSTRGWGKGGPIALGILSFVTSTTVLSERPVPSTRRRWHIFSATNHFEVTPTVC